MVLRSNDAVLMDAITFLPGEECVSGMVGNPLDAESKDAKMEQSKEEFASDMGHKPNDAAMMVAQTKLIKEECVVGMVERANYVASKDAKTCQLDLAYVEDTERIDNVLFLIAKIVLRVEGCALGTIQSLRSNYAVVKDAQTSRWSVLEAWKCKIM